MKKVRLILRFGLSLIRLCPGHVTAYVAYSFISQTAIPLALPLLLAEITNAFQAAAPGARQPNLTSPYIWWLVLTFSLFPLAILFRLAQTNMDNRMEKEIREKLFDKVIRQAPEFFYRYNPGQLINVLTQTSIETQQALRSLTVDPLLQVVSVCIATALIVHELGNLKEYAAWVWPLVILMVLFGLASAVVVQLKGQKPVDKAQRDVQMHRFSLMGLCDSVVKSPEEIQAMDAEKLFSDRHDKALDKMMALKRHQVFTMEIVNSAIGLPTQVILASLYGLIVYVAIPGHGGMQPGVFIALAGLTPQLMQPFRAFAMLGITASSSWPAVELVTNLLDEENRIRDLPGAKEIATLEPTLEARNVTFRYGPTLPKVFDDLSFSVPPGKITSLVARMGQGKTTFFRLALRFYDPDEGQVLIGGVPTTSFKLQNLRQHAVLMSQFPSFFHDSVRDNFRIAKPDATDAEIQHLCETTGLWSMLQKAVGGPDTLDKPFAAGMGFSGGQKRLFALTRCLLRNPTFLFLDEPTTNMSNDEKYVLIPMMRAALAGRTVVVVDHDISWLVQFCDHFVVLDSGKIVQNGSSEELLACPGVLQELYSLAVPGSSGHEAPGPQSPTMGVAQRG
jgi:ABC-type multidrug transport system fused ATPase/permease subunit